MSSERTEVKRFITLFVWSVVVASILSASTGCSVFWAATLPARKDLSVLDGGTPRSRVIAELGAPVRSGEKDGNKVDVFYFQVGCSPGEKAVMVLSYLALDIFTLGLWEGLVAFAKSFSGGGGGAEQVVAMETFYDEKDRVKSAKEHYGPWEWEMPQTRPIESKEATVRTGAVHTGARRAGAIQEKSYYVAYAPQKDLQWARLGEASAGKKLGFQLLDFYQNTHRQIGNGFHLDKAGELFSLAIARQLEEMGFVAALKFTQFADPSCEEKFIFKEGDYSKHITVLGHLEFLVEFTSKESGAEARAFLSSSLAFLGDGGREIEKRLLFQTNLQAEEKLLSPSLEDASGRFREAAGAVLRRVVKKLFSDPRLEETLVKFVNS